MEWTPVFSKDRVKDGVGVKVMQKTGWNKVGKGIQFVQRKMRIKAGGEWNSNCAEDRVKEAWEWNPILTHRNKGCVERNPV
jgi:hypothetical protein